MTIASLIVLDALQEIGILDGSEVPSANDAARGLRALNGVLDSLSLQNMGVFVQNNYTFNLVAGQSTYTIGPDGDFVSRRFTGVMGAYCRWQEIDFPIELIDDDQYNNIAFKAQTGPIVQFLLFSATMPDSTVTLWPVPSANNTITLLTNQLFATPFGPFDDLGLPPGYDRFLIKATAIELASIFGLEPSPTLVGLARSALTIIKRQNQLTPVLQYDAALPSGYRGWGNGSVAYGPGPVAPVSGGGVLALNGLSLALDGLLLALA